MTVPADSSLEECEEDLPVEELARRQRIRLIISVDELAELDAFGSDAELDEFLADLYASRQGQHRVSCIVPEAGVVPWALLARS